MLIRNKLIPFKGYEAINICGVIFIREDSTASVYLINHEAIHTKQMLELGIVLFYIWYVIEWLIRLCIYRNFDKAYYNISFEQEAYDNQYDLEYKSKRSHYYWINYLINKHK